MSENNKSITGLHISDFSAEIVWAKKENDFIEIISSNRILFSEGVLENGRIINPKVLLVKLNDLFKNAKPFPIPRDKKIFFAFSQASLFIHVFNFFSEEKKDLTEIIRKEAEWAIPIKKDEIAILYKKIKINEKKQKIILFAMRQEIISEWNAFFEKNIFFVQRFEIEPFAFFRALSSSALKDPICLVDIGLNTISISFFSNKGFLYGQQSQYGGKYISEKLARGLKIDFMQAEELKKKISLIYESTDKENAREILNMVFVHIAEEIKNSLYQFRENYPDCGKVSKIFLLGGVSNTGGIVDFFKRHFVDIEVARANRIFSQADLPIEYISAFGLANIGLSESKQKSDPAFFPRGSRTFLKFNLKHFSFLIFLVLFIYFFNFSQNNFFIQAPEPVQEVKFKSADIIEEPDKPNPAGNDLPLEKPSNQNFVGEKEKTNPLVKIIEIDSSLNVRLDAGTDFEIIGKVFSGQEFDFIQEKSGWYEIELNENTNGWVFSEYAEKIE